MCLCWLAVNFHIIAANWVAVFIVMIDHQINGFAVLQLGVKGAEWQIITVQQLQHHVDGAITAGTQAEH